jgi:ferredoxin-NADP reductase
VEAFYRLTIKKELPPENKPEIGPGLSSSFFHETVRTGTVIEANPPAGDFWLDLQKDHPIAMLDGGILVTPMMSMLEALARVRSLRDVYFFFGLRHAGDRVQGKVERDSSRMLRPADEYFLRAGARWRHYAPGL